MFARKVQVQRTQPNREVARVGAGLALGQHVRLMEPNTPVLENGKEPAAPGMLPNRSVIHEPQHFKTAGAAGPIRPAWNFGNISLFPSRAELAGESMTAGIASLAARRPEAMLSQGHRDGGLEREADGLAREVLQGLNQQSPSEGSCCSIGMRTVQPAVPDGGGEVPLAAVAEPIGSAGQPLDPSIRGRLERHFRWNFSQVRIHADEVAARSAERLSARAYTLGGHVMFNAGAYAPHTLSGQRLLAHELAHVAQQSHGAAMIQRVPADTPATSSPQFAPVTTEEQEAVARGFQEALGVPLTPEDMWQQLLTRRAGPLSSPAYVVAKAPAELESLDQQIASKTNAFKKARGKNRAAIGQELKGLKTRRQQLARGLAFGSVGEGRVAGTGQITYAGIQVENASGRRIALEFAETTGTQHAEEEIVERLREMILSGRLREADLVGARMVVVGDQFVCQHVGRCRTALSQFAADYKLRSVESTVFQRESFTTPGALASPRTTLRTMTRSAGQPAPLMRTDETLYFDASKGSGGGPPRSSAPRPANVSPAAESAAERATTPVGSEAEGALKGVERELVREVENPSVLGKVLRAGPKVVKGVVVGYVTNRIATATLHGNKFEQEKAALDAANRVPPSKKEDPADAVLGLVPPGWDIALGAVTRFVMDRAYDAIEQDRRRQVEDFYRLNPDADEGAFDRMQDLQYKWEMGLIDW
jgi:hypothetical protein